MALIVTNKQHYSDIATAIREAKGTQATYKPSQMAGAVLSIQSHTVDTLKTVLDQKGTADGLFKYDAFLAEEPAVNFNFLNYDTTELVTSMDSAFESQSIITTIPLIDTRQVTTFKGMFSECESLESCPALDCTSATENNALYHMFYRCTSLAEINIINIKQDLDLYYCNALTTSGIHTVIENLVDVNRSRTLSKRADLEVTPQDIYLASTKGWTIADSQG